MIRYFNFLSGISGCFWLLSRLTGIWALAVHDVLIAELADCFAILYNGVLAVAFSSVMALSIARLGPTGLLWHQALGFIFVYFVLSAAYSRPGTHEVDDHSILGYLAGLCAYLLFSLFPGYLDQPRLVRFLEMLQWMAQGWIGKVLTFFAAIKIARMLLRSARELLSSKPPIRLRQ